MKGKNDRSRLLNKLFEISKMGMEASEIIIPKTHGKELRDQIKKQDENYINLMEKAQAMLKLQDEQPEGVSDHKQRILRSSIQMNTFMRHNPQHIAELMVNGSVKGVVTMTKAMNHTPDCDVETRKLAEDYIETEEQNIDMLKKFL